VQYVLIPASGLKDGNPGFRVSRERDGLEPLVYTNIEQMLEDYKSDIVTLPNLPRDANLIANSCAAVTTAVETGSG
jgi:tyrosyl-tRNA synthetase